MEEISSHFIITESPTGYVIRWKHNHRAIRRYLIDIDGEHECYMGEEGFPSLFNLYGIGCEANHNKEECLSRAQGLIQQLDRYMTFYDKPGIVKSLRQEGVKQYGEVSS